MDDGWVRNCKEKTMLLFKELYIFLFLERLECIIVKNNTRLAVVWSGFERITALKQVYLLVCPPSGSCWRRQVWSLRPSHVDILLFGGYI